MGLLDDGIVEPISIDAFWLASARVWLWDILKQHPRCANELGVRVMVPVSICKRGKGLSISEGQHFHLGRGTE